MAAVQCPNCGALTAAGTGFCQYCRAPLQAYPAPPQPVYAQPYAPQYPQAYPAPYGYPYGAPPMYPGVYAPPMYYQPAYVLPFTPERRMQGMASAARGARARAAALDTFIVLAIWAFLFFIVYPAAFGQTFGLLPPHLELRLPITVFVIFLYYGIQDGFGGTLGKRVMGVRLVDVELRPIGFAAGVLRAVEVLVWLCFMLLSVIGIIGAILVYASMLDKNGQAVGDRLAHCWVVKRSDLVAAGTPA